MTFIKKVLIFIVLSAAFSMVNADSLPDFSTLVEQNAAAVVNISTTVKVNRGGGFLDPRQFDQLGPWGELFRHFLEDQQQGQQPGNPGPSERHHSLGSGFVISEDGYIVTNNHVIEGADKIIVKFSDRSELTAELVGADKSSDIALLKVKAKQLSKVKLGQADKLKVGDWVLAIGSPFGFDASVTAGIVSAKGRALPNENYVPFLQTDVAINPGNSGGPLFNLEGEVIGVNAQIYSRTGGFMGLSFAIPIEVALDVVEQLKENGTVSRGWLGVQIQEVTKDLAESFGLDKPRGALVASVVEDGPAERAGLMPGDVILSFDGRLVPRSAALPPMVGKMKAGEQVTLIVQRAGKKKSIKVKLSELNDDGKTGKKLSDNTAQDKLGMTITELTPQVRQRFDVANGGVLVTALIRGGAAVEGGIQRGDVITHVNNQKIKDVEHFAEVVEAVPPGQVVPFLVARRYGREFLAVRIPVSE